MSLLTPYEIYVLLRGGPGSATLGSAQRTARLEADREFDRALLIDRLAEKIQTGWRGEAGDAASGAAKPLASNAMEGGGQLSIAQDLLARQGESFHGAANSVLPVSSEPPRSIILTDAAPYETDHDLEIERYRERAAHNINVYRGYDDASLFNETNLPAWYSMADHPGAGVTVTPSDGPTPDPGGTSSGVGREAAGERARPAAGAGAPGDSAAPAATSQNDFVPAPGATVPANGPTPANGTAPPGQLPPVPGLVGLSLRGDSFEPGRRDTAPGRGARGVPGTGAGGSGAGTGGPGGGGAGTGRPGAGGGPAAEDTARRGGIGGGGRGHGGGGLPVGAGRDRDEDAEHERKVLFEPDGKDTFGSDVATAPQVIGDDAYLDRAP